MSFHLNNAQQMAMYDSLLSLNRKRNETSYELLGRNIWQEDILFIDEDRFSLSYSDNPASRPNNSVTSISDFSS